MRILLCGIRSLEMGFAAKGFNTYHQKNEGFTRVVDKRGMMLARLFDERAEWAVNGQEQVLLALPHAVAAPIRAVRIDDAACTVEYEDGTSAPVPVPVHVAPFLARCATMLVVTLKGSSVITETDVFVTSGRQAGARKDA